MTTTEGVARGPLAQLRTASVDDADLIRQAVELGNPDRKTLGFLPPAAYEAAAGRDTLLVAVADETVVGYALYRLSHNRVALAHLCVRRDLRGQGLAHHMVEHISDRHQDYLGILVKCRRSYGLDPMWIRLGFRQRTEMRGRSEEGHPLVAWWRDHGHIDLFTRPEPAALRAAIDLNILRDLVDASRPDAVESRALQADHIFDQLELVVTPGLLLEIAAIDGRTMRERCTRVASELTDVRGQPDQADEIEKQILARVKIDHPSYPATAQDRADLRHVAEAAAAGLTVLVSRDQELTRIVGPIAARDYGLRILRPVDVLLHVDELVQAQVYRPAAVAGSDYRSQRIGAGRQDDLLPFVNRLDHERPNDFRKRLRQLAVSGTGWEAISAPDGQLVALYSFTVDQHLMDVPVLRVLPHRNDDTIARQLLFTLRRTCRDLGRPLLRITDPHPSHVVQQAAIADGLHHADGGWHAFVIDACADADTVWQTAMGAARHASLPEPAPLRSSMPAVAAAEIERTWWPAKLLDSDLLSYVVSIQPRWSTELFGVPATLTPRVPQLALSRDHVYYRSPRPAAVQAPARILWYLSSDSRHPHQPGVIACSHLDAVLADDPETLFERFRHLGVWSINEVRAAARQGKAQALRFTNTDTFPRPVPLARLTQLGREHGGSAVPQGPRRIPAQLFAAIYREGYPTP